MSHATPHSRRDSSSSGGDTRPLTQTGRRASRWLLLVLQLPTNPSRVRVKAWRRLQQLGAVAIKNAVYVLPDSPQAREDFEWLKVEIMANKGDASIFAADTIESLADDDIVAAFRTDRQRSFTAIRAEAQKLASHRANARARGSEMRTLQRAVRPLRDRFRQLVAVDFFRAAGREEADAALADLDRVLAGPTLSRPARPDGAKVLRLKDYRGRIWLTRPRPGIDRAGSAWLIRRFIDPAARFAFGERARPGSPKSVAFDMYDVEFSHRGDRCTFEVLTERFGIADPAVAELGRLVHDLDLKERRYNVPEAATVGQLMDGLRKAYSRDDELLEHGIVLFEALYRAFTSRLVSQDNKRQGRRRQVRKEEDGRT